MAKYGLDLEQKNRNNKKLNRNIIIIFLCFVVLLGIVSTFLLWRHYNYDFKNILIKQEDESTTSAPTTTEVDSVKYYGEYNFLLGVTSDDIKETLFFNIINVNLEDKTIRVIPVDDGITDLNTNLTCNQLLISEGGKKTAEFVGNYFGVKIDRFAVLKESDFKSFFRAMGNINIKIPENIEYDTPDMFLELSRGDNVLTPDKTYKYMKYLCETKDGYERSKANANIVVSAFTSFCTLERFNSADNTFSVIIDYCVTDITIVDFTNAKDELLYLMPKTSKEKLKVFVSDNIKKETSEESIDGKEQKASKDKKDTKGKKTTK